MLHASSWSRFELTTSVVIGTDCICSCKSNYHTITATMENPLIHWQHSAQDTEERQTKKQTPQRKMKRWATRTEPKSGRGPWCSWRLRISCFVEDTRHVIHIVKPVRELYWKGNEKFYIKEKRFVTKWVFRSEKPVRDDACIIFAGMTTL